MSEPTFYGSTKKYLLVVKKDPFYRGVINPAAKKCYGWGKLPMLCQMQHFRKSVVATEFPKIFKELINLYSYALQFLRYSMGMKFPCQCVGIQCPCHYVGMKFQQNGVGIKFPQTIRWNCILLIILHAGAIQGVSQGTGCL